MINQNIRIYDFLKRKLINTTEMSILFNTSLNKTREIVKGIRKRYRTHYLKKNNIFRSHILVEDLFDFLHLDIKEVYLCNDSKYNDEIDSILKKLLYTAADCMDSNIYNCKRFETSRRKISIIRSKNNEFYKSMIGILKPSEIIATDLLYDLGIKSEEIIRHLACYI